ncbi:hypothetical protein FKM82_007671 [Ascaphus truei]
MRSSCAACYWHLRQQSPSGSPCWKGLYTMKTQLNFIPLGESLSNSWGHLYAPLPVRLGIGSVSLAQRQTHTHAHTRTHAHARTHIRAALCTLPPLYTYKYSAADYEHYIQIIMALPTLNTVTPGARAPVPSFAECCAAILKSPAFFHHSSRKGSRGCPLLLLPPTQPPPPIYQLKTKSSETGMWKPRRCRCVRAEDTEK